MGEIPEKFFIPDVVDVKQRKTDIGPPHYSNFFYHL